MLRYTRVLVLLMLACVPAFAGDSESCSRAFPSDRQFPANYADIVEKFRKDVCEGDVARDPEHQRCILNRLRGVGRRPHTGILAQAWNDCLPSYRSCKTRDAGLSSRTSAAGRAMIEANCRDWPDVSASEQLCSAERATAYPETSRKNPNFIRASCLSILKPCVDRLMGIYTVTDKDSIGLDAMALACSLRNETPTRECILREIDYVGLTPLGIRAAEKLCDRTTDAERLCVKDALIMGQVSADVRADFGKAIEEGLFFCRRPSATQSCAASLVRDERWSTRTAIGLCEGPSPESVACMKTLLRNTGDPSQRDAARAFERDSSSAWNTAHIAGIVSCRLRTPRETVTPRARSGLGGLLDALGAR